MRITIKVLFVVPLILLLSACATPPQRQALSVENRHLIKSDKMIVNSTQHMIGAHQGNWMSSDRSDPYAEMDSGAIVRHSDVGMASTGSLTSALASLIVTSIEKHRETKGQASIEPVRKSLDGFDYMVYFKNQVSGRLSKLSWLKLKNQSLMYNIRESEESLVNASIDNSTLLVGATYALNSKMKQLEVVSYVKLLKKNFDPKKTKPTTLYENNFYYIYRLDKPNDKLAHNEERWLANHGLLLKQKLRDAAGLLAEQIALDIKNPERTPAQNLLKTVKLKNIDGETVLGRVLREKNSLYTVSLLSKGYGNGYIYIVNSNSLVH